MIRFLILGMLIQALVSDGVIGDGEIVSPLDLDGIARIMVGEIHITTDTAGVLHTMVGEDIGE